MKESSEKKWMLYLLILGLIAFGIITKFDFGKNFELQLHDTYYVIANHHLLLILSVFLMLYYGLILVLKQLAQLNKHLRLLVITILTASALIVLLLVIGSFIWLFSVLSDISNSTTPVNELLGVILLLIGLVIMNVMRIKEVKKL